jgi:predicted NUDIX family NTP pyrophosphohydrolase
MPERSAGVLLFRRTGDEGTQVWLGHMGGPFWRRRPRAWSIPKGLLEPGEDEREAALREFAEEIGVPAPQGIDYRRLGEFRQPSGKVVIAFAGESEFSVAEVLSNTFTLEWPRGSGVLRECPEIDEARWFPLAEAREVVVAGQLPILAALERALDPESASEGR